MCDFTVIQSTVATESRRGCSWSRNHRGVLLRAAMILGQLTALGLAAHQTAFLATSGPITVVDDGGPDDEPGQKDLNQMTVDFDSLPTSIDVSWNWDEIGWSGSNTGDACSLFDTDDNGFADYSLCVVVAGTPATYSSTRLYSCGDDKADRCSQPVALIPTFESSCYAEVVTGSDPFSGDPDHQKTEGTPGADDDTVATCTIEISDFGSINAFLLNVCSYPSQEPNSDPSDCVVVPQSGFLTIVKDAGDDVSTDFTFDLGSGQASNDARTSFTVTGSGSIDLISFLAGTYDLSEVVPLDWDLDGAECRLPDGTLTGNWSDSTVAGFSIEIGRETTCSFMDSLKPIQLTLEKTVITDDGGTATQSDFRAYIDGSPYDWDVAQTLSEGTYTLSESTLFGYAASDWTCVDLEGSPFPVTGGDQVSLSPGGNVTCTITNDDVAPSITLIKVAINDNGGTAGPNGFGLTIGGTAVNSGQSLAVDANTPYALDEAGLTGYGFVSIGQAAGDSAKCPDALGDEVTLGEGEHITCTIKNDDIQPQLIVIKHVINNDRGEASASDFTIIVDGSSPSPATFPGEEAPGTVVSLNAGSFGLDETGPDSYGASYSADCSGEISIGDTKTCTITNDDLTPICPEIVPIDLFYVLDISGSMRYPFTGDSGEVSKLQAAKDAITFLNGQLGPLDSDSRVGLITFRGDGSLPISYIDVEVDSPLTTDLSAVEAIVDGLAADGSTPTSHAINLARQEMLATLASGHLPVVFLISDGVPTVDQDLHGFLDADVEIVPIKVDGSWRSVDDVRNDGVFYSSYGEYSGETLADVMVAAQDFMAAIPNAQIYTIAVEGHFFNARILEYVAHVGNGDTFFADQYAEMQTGLVNAINQSACILDIQKTGDEVVAVGDEIHYQIKVTNRGAIELTGVTLSDITLGLSNMPVGDGSLDPGQSVTVTATYGPTTSGDVPYVENTATADSNETPEVFDTWTTLVIEPNPGIDLEKNVSTDGGVSWIDADFGPGPTVNAGTPLYFRLQVRNTGNVPLSNLALEDTDFDAQIASQCSLPATLTEGEAFACIIGPIPAVTGQHQNNATASGDYHGLTESDFDRVNYKGVQPKIDVEKYVTVDHGETWLDADFPTGPSVPEGSLVWFRFTITNNAPATLDNISLSDSDFDAEIAEQCTIPSSLAPGETFDDCVIGPLLAQSGQHENTATASGEHGATNHTDSDDAHYFGEPLVCEPGNLYIKSIWPALVEIDPLTLRLKDEDSFWPINKATANPYGDYAWGLSGVGSASDPHLYFSLSSTRYPDSSAQCGVYAMDLSTGYASQVQSVGYLSPGLAQFGEQFYTVSGATIHFQGGGSVGLPETIGGIDLVSREGELFLLAISGVPGHQQVWRVPLDESTGAFEGGYSHLLSINAASSPALYSYSYTGIAHGYIPTDGGAREVIFVSKDDGSIEPWDLVAIIDYQTGNAIRVVRSPDSGRILKHPITWPNGVTSGYLNWANPQGLEWIGGRLFLVSLNYWNKGPKLPPCMPAIEVTKEAPGEAVVGEAISYAFSVDNPGDTPLFDIHVIDSELGDLTSLFEEANGGWDELPVGGGPVNFTLDYTVQETDTDPLVNQVTASASYQGVRTEGIASHSLDLVPPISIEKSGPDLAVIRDTVEYDMTVTNRGYLPLEGGTVTDPSIGFSAAVSDLMFENHLFSGTQDPAWSPIGATGTWSIVEVENGNFIGRHTTVDPSTFPDAIYVSSGGGWTNYSAALDLRLDTSNRFPGGARARANISTGAGYSVWIYPVDGKIRLWKSTDWQISPAGRTELAAVDQSVAPGWHHLRLDLEGDQIRVYWDGARLISTTDSTYSAGTFALEPGRAENLAGVRFDYDNLVVQTLPALLAPDQSAEYHVNATVPEDSPDPLVNVATATGMHGSTLAEDSDDHVIDIVEPTTCDTSLSITQISSAASNVDVEFDGQKYYTAHSGLRSNDSASPVVIGDPIYIGGNYSTTVPFDFLDEGVQVDEGGRFLYSYLGDRWRLPLSSDASCRTVSVYVAVLHTGYYSQYSSFDISVGDLTQGLEVRTYRSSRYSYEITVTFSGDIELEMAPTRSTSSSYFLLGGAVVDPGGLPINQSPAGDPEAYSVDEDGMLEVPAPGVLANDNDADEDPLTATLDTGPANGVLGLNPDGSFSYEPVADFEGEDSFTYRAHDGFSYSHPVTVTITVNPLNDAPLAHDDAYSTDEDMALEVGPPGILVNDEDLDGDSLSAILGTGPTHGTLALNANGTFTYTAAEEFSGVDTFQYLANDGTVDSNLATVTIAVQPVDDPPSAQDDSYTIFEDEILSAAAPGVLVNDDDPEGGTLSANPVSTPAHGTLSMFSNGSFTYVPDPDFSGMDRFTYLVNDGVSDSNVATVDIKVNPVNDLPLAADDSYEMPWETTLEVGAPGVLGNDSDVETSVLTAVLVDDAASGKLTLNSDGSFSYGAAPGFSGEDGFTYKARDGSDGSNLATVTIVVSAVNRPPDAADDAASTDEDHQVIIDVLGNDSDLDGDSLSVSSSTSPGHGDLALNGDGAIAYTPGPDYYGADGFEYTVSDGQGGEDSAHVSITVNPINDPPSAGDDAASTNEGEAVTIDLLANDSDVDGDPLDIQSIDIPSNGSLSNHGDGTITYTPDDAFVGDEIFGYVATDGHGSSDSATVTVTVAPACETSITIDYLASVSSGYVIELDGREYYTARHEVRGNEGASPLVLGDFAYTGVGYDGRYALEFQENGVPVDDGGRYMLTSPGNQWSIPLTGMSACRTVTFYIVVMHTDFRAQGSRYEIHAGDASETLEVITSTSARRIYAVDVTFAGEVDVEMQATYSSTTDKAFFELGAGVVEAE